LGHDLATEHTTPGVQRALTHKEIRRHLLKIHQFKKGGR
jgi:hypothetical protein